MFKTTSMRPLALVLIAALIAMPTTTSSAGEFDVPSGSATEKRHPDTAPIKTAPIASPSKKANAAVINTDKANTGIKASTFTAPAIKASATSDGLTTTGTKGGGTPDGVPRPDDVGTPGGKGGAEPPSTGGGREGGGGGREGGGGGRRDHDNFVPAVLVGAAAIFAIGTLLARERTAASQPAPQDQIVERLLTDGPMLATAFNMSAFAVRGFVRGNWPLVIDFQQRSPGTAQLQISARDLPDIFTYDLSAACPPPRRCLIRMQLPTEIFGDQLRPAVIAATATDAKGHETQPEFDVYALGAGPRAVGSVAIDEVSFGPSMIRVTEHQRALYRFYSHSDFSNTSVEFWKVDNGTDGTRLYLVDDRLIDGGIRKNQWIGMNERREWDGTEKGRKVSSGRHKVQVRAWDRVGDWVTAWSNEIVTVEQ